MVATMLDISSWREDECETSCDVRVAIIENDEWLRRGFAAALREIEGLEIVALLDEDAALDSGVMWSQVDAVLVDAGIATSTWDSFVSIRVIEHIASTSGQSKPRVLALTDFAWNSML